MPLPVLGPAAQQLRPTFLPPATIIGLDPSVRAYGWALLRLDHMPHVLDAGCILTERDEDAAYRFEDDGARIDAIAQTLLRVFARAMQLGPLCVAMEAPAGSQSATSAKMLGFAYAITRTLCIARNVRPIAIRAAEVKLAIAGDKDAEKLRVAEGVERVTGWTSSAKSPAEREAEADAVAVALAGARRAAR